MAPESEHAQADLIEEGYDSDKNYAIVNPDLNKNATFTDADKVTGTVPHSIFQTDSKLLSDIDYRHLVQSLNSNQRLPFQQLLNWYQKQSRQS